MTKIEIMKEIESLRKWLYNNVTSREYNEVMRKHDEHLKACGHKRLYLPKSAKKAEYESYLECYINACYDVLKSERMTDYLYSEV